MAVLEKLEPKSVFNFFEQIGSIPHGSRDTKKISDYLVSFAKERDLRYIQDELNNVIIFKDGTEGYENSSPVIIQGHMDMVCEKTADCDIDFTKDGLKLCTDGDWVWADKTTLGGDDGIAVAIALAILDAPKGSISHPPLEVVITVDEEIGMLGADFIDCSVLKANTMLNLDSEEEGVLLVSCAGGATVCCSLTLDTENIDYANKTLISFNIDGATGGHSGVNIDKQRANSAKLIGRILASVKKDVNLVYVAGGLKDNAIPRNAAAVVAVDKDKAEDVKTNFDLISEDIKKEYSSTDPELTITMSDNSDTSEYSLMLTKDDSDKAINTLLICPNGIRKMSVDIEGMVQTSLNLGIMKLSDELDKKKLIMSFCVRSSVESEKKELLSELESLMALCGGRIDITGEYPSWEFKKDSVLRTLMTNSYEELFGKTPKVEAIHAGVECGHFAGKIDGLDCVSFGPDIKDIHTTAERLSVDSTARTYEYTLDILKKLR